MTQEPTRPLRCGASGVVALGVVMALLSGCSSRMASGTAPSPTASTSTVSLVPGSVPPPTDPVPPVLVASSSSLPAHDVLAGLAGIQAGVDECLRLPVACNPGDWAQEGTQAYRVLDGLRQYYVANKLVAQIVPELTYVVPESVHMLGPDRADITLCEVDGSWQMDSRHTRTTDDDIVWDDLVVSRRARHVLVRTNGRWRRAEITELEFWPGENRCPALVTL